MADTVRVQFSASIGALIKGVEDAKSAIESVKESTDRVTEGAKSMLQAFGLAFSAGSLVAMVSQMADLGEQIERTSAILGTSTRETQQLGFIAKATGGDAQSLTMAMERLQVNLAAAQNPTSRQALALQSLGLSAKQLLGIPLDEQLNRIADAALKFAPGGNLTADVLTLMGRGAAGMLPAIEKGRAGIDDLRQSAENAGAIMSNQTVEALDRMHVEIVTLRASATALAGTLTAELGTALQSVGNSITSFLGNITALISAGNFWQNELEGIGYAVLSLTVDLVRMGTIAKDAFTLNWGAIADDWKAGTKAQEDLLQQHLYNLGVLLLKSKAEIQGQLSEAVSTKPQAPAMAVKDTSAISAQMEQFQAQIKLADAAYKQTQEQLGAEVKLHQITYDQETQLLLAALDKRHTAEIAALSAEQQIGGLTTAQYQKITDERKLIDQKYAADHQKIINQALEKDAQAWQSLLTPIASAFDSQLKGILNRTETWGTAMKRIFQDLVMDAIKYLEKLAIEKAAAGLASITGASPSSFLGQLLGGGGQAAAQTANTSAVTALTLAVTANTAALGGSAATSAAGAAVGSSGGFLSGFASLFKMFAIPGFAAGTDLVLGGGLAMVHPNESIVPARGSGPFTGAGMVGGDTIHNWNISAWDGPSVQSWLTRGGTLQLMRAFSGASPLNPSLA